MVRKRQKRIKAGCSGVYELYDTIRGCSFYVGQASNFGNRFWGHIREFETSFDADRLKHVWIQELAWVYQVLPEMRVIEHVADADLLNGRERFWIHQRLKEGVPLVNEVLPAALRGVQFSNLSRWAAINADSWVAACISRL
jgi:hypothetical protein